MILHKRFLSFCCVCVIAIQTSISQNNSLFTLLPSSVTGVNFVNKVVETPDINIVTYEYFYNGGGVAAGDFNNDGLTDLYFTANVLPNKLYLNKGNFQFQDITRQSNAGGKRGWKTGVSVADVNGDGWLDIYVCYSGDIDAERRKNQLLINNGNLTFTDKAEEMGIADQGYTTHAAFLDYDRDGDLDLFVLNHNVKELRNFDAAFVKKMVDPDAGDRLYRNDNNHFTNVTGQAGIISNPLGYGLSVVTSDVNNDGWPDLYVSNDYVEEDYLYINNGDGMFTEKLKEQLGHISNFSMGVDIADINNDGLADIYTLDMLPADNKRQKLLYTPDNYELYNNMLKNGFYHQLMRNMLQVNNGNGTFSETGQSSGVSNTDWSWAALFADFNNDGYKDLFVTNGYGRDMTNRDFVKFYANERLKFRKGEPSERMFQMLQGIKSTPLHCYMFENKGNLQFKDCSLDWGFDAVNFSHGAVYTDLDNDGDLDLVVNRMNDEAAIYRNNVAETNSKGNYLKVILQMEGGNTNALGAKVQVFTPAGKTVLENYPVHGFQSSMQEPLHFGLPSNIIDSLLIRWPNGETQTVKDVVANKSITIKYTKTGQYFRSAPVATIFNTAGAIPFRHTEDETNDFKIQPLMPNMLSYSGPAMAKADINNDGLEDIYIGGAKNQQGQLLLQQRSGGFSNSTQNSFAEDALSEDTDALFFDADSDDDMDLYVVSGGYSFTENDKALQDRLYVNEKGIFVKNINALPAETVSGSCVRAADVDADGDNDLFVGGRVIPGRYPESPESFLLLNDGKGKFTNVTSAAGPALQQLGMVTDAIWLDLNKDNKPDLVVCGEWMKIYCFENINGKFIDATEKYFSTPLHGWWNRMAIADLDSDGDTDIVAGNWGTNSQLQVSQQEPATLCFGDFDNNGSIDPILCYYIQGKSYPMPSRDEMTDQVVSLRQKFPTYDSYSDAGIQDILTPEQLQTVKTLKADFFETVWFENRNGVFVQHSLPVQASYAPVYAIGIDDYDHDGKKDILLAGNIEHTRIKIGKIDANYGVLLKGDGLGHFTYMPQVESGLNIKGCVRSVVPITNSQKEKIVVFGVNNQLPVVYRY
ncbi:VCBS repeat-containing protein [Terrimonas pollutisoli]|uniref:VCBS repeat-containing protein n=1 Tax=Terrimonas pollutisoli TaxID=3034147 RepID=UPI0023EBA490|nr:VCBS repeat-containing protein [Terrimonas sp. H1YJ31]